LKRKSGGALGKKRRKLDEEKKGPRLQRLGGGRKKRVNLLEGPKIWCGVIVISSQQKKPRGRGEKNHTQKPKKQQPPGPEKHPKSKTLGTDLRKENFKTSEQEFLFTTKRFECKEFRGKIKENKIVPNDTKRGARGENLVCQRETSSNSQHKWEKKKGGTGRGKNRGGLRDTPAEKVPQGNWEREKIMTGRKKKAKRAM